MMKGRRPQLETVLETDALEDTTDNEVTTHPLQRSTYADFDTATRREGNGMLLETLFAYKRKLVLAERKLQAVELKRDSEMRYIVSKLLLLESRLISDKNLVEETIREKDETIQHLRQLLERETRRRSEGDSVDGRVDIPGSSLKRRQNIDHKRTLRNIKCYSSPASCDAGCQTEDSDRDSEVPMFYLEPEVLTREHRSYSNPDDPELAYEKTSDMKVKEKDMVIINTENTSTHSEQRRDSLLPMKRKKSLSSPDLHQLLMGDGSDSTSSTTNEKNWKELHPSDYFNEVDSSISANLASPRPSLPNIAGHSLSIFSPPCQNKLTQFEVGSPTGETYLRTSSLIPQIPSGSFHFPAACCDTATPDSIEARQPGSAQMNPRVRKHGALLMKPKLYLRSYSTPDPSLDENFSKMVPLLPKLAQQNNVEQNTAEDNAFTNTKLLQQAPMSHASREGHDSSDDGDDDEFSLVYKCI